MTIRSMHHDDAAAALAINDLNVDDVGPLDADQLSGLLADSVIALVAVGPEDQLVGFALVVDGTCGHLSPRAAWALEAAHPDLHLERVTFDMRYSGYGLGLALYDELDERIDRRTATAPGRTVTLTSMVRLDPPNDHAIGFHTSRGFATVDQADFDGTTIGVAVKTYRSSA